MTQSDQDIRDIVRGTGANMLGFFARFGSRVPFIFLAGLLYGAAAFGRYVLVVAIIETIACLPVLALNRTLFRFLSEAEARGDRAALQRTVMSGVVIAGAAGAAAAGLVMLAADALAAAFRSPDAGQMLRLLALTLPLTTISTVLLAATRHRRIMRYEIFTRNIVEPLTLSVAVAALYFLGHRETGLVTAHIVALAVGFGFAVWYFSRVFSLKECLAAGIDRPQIAAVVRFSTPTALYDFLNVAILRVDIMLLAYFTTDSVVGVYGMAIQFVTFAKKIRQAFDPILTPVVSQGLVENDVQRVKHQLTLVSRWVLSAQMVVLLLFAFYAERLLGLVGEAFTEGALTLAILCLGFAINGCLGVSELPIVFRRPIINPLNSALMLGLNVALNLLLIPKFGAEGAALATVITYTAMNAVRLVVVRYLLGVWMLRGFLLKPLLAGLITALVLAALATQLSPQKWHGVGAGVAALLVSYTSMLLLLGLEPEEASRLGRLVSRVRGGLLKARRTSS